MEGARTLKCGRTPSFQIESTAGSNHKSCRHFINSDERVHSWLQEVEDSWKIDPPLASCADRDVTSYKQLDPSSRPRSDEQKPVSEEVSRWSDSSSSCSEGSSATFWSAFWEWVAESDTDKVSQEGEGVDCTDLYLHQTSSRFVESDSNTLVAQWRQTALVRSGGALSISSVKDSFKVDRPNFKTAGASTINVKPSTSGFGTMAQSMVDLRTVHVRTVDVGMVDGRGSIAHGQRWDLGR